MEGVEADRVAEFSELAGWLEGRGAGAVQSTLL